MPKNVFTIILECLGHFLEVLRLFGDIGKTSISTSFLVRAEPKNWSKNTALVLRNKREREVNAIKFIKCYEK